MGPISLSANKFIDEGNCDNKVRKNANHLLLSMMILQSSTNQRVLMTSTFLRNSENIMWFIEGS